MNLTIDQQKNLKKAQDKFGIVFLVLFGSYLTGKTNKESDLDIAVLLQKPLPENHFLDLYSFLQDIFRGLNLHLNLLNNSDILFRQKILTGGQLLLGDYLDFSKYKTMTHKIYLTDMPKITKYYDKILKNNQDFLKGVIYGR